MQASAFIATSLDGFIARPDFTIDWLENASSDATEDYGYEDFVATVSTVILGRKTFQKILSFPEWPFQHQRIIVLSSTLSSAPESLGDQVQLFNGDVAELALLLDAEGDNRIYIDGSRAIQSFINAGLLNDITITTVPILIGKGIALFGEQIPKDISLKHINTRAFQNGFVQSTYTITI